MMNISRQHVIILEDEPAVSKAIAGVLEGINIRTSSYVDPAMCLARLRSHGCSLLITDMKMPELDGIEVIQLVKRTTPWIPVLVISGYGDIPTVVRAMKAGAVDFIEKPLNRKVLIDKVTSILQESDYPYTDLCRPLSPTETNVLTLVLDGKTSKEIGNLLHRSTRTIEWHRSRLMHKLKAESMLDLIKRVGALGLIDMMARSDLARAIKRLN